MKQYICAFLMFLSLLIGFQQSIFYVHFELNRDRIEREHCVNRNRPELQCHGLCYLADVQEQADSKNEKKALVNTYKKVDIVFVSRIDLLPVLKTVKMMNHDICYIEKDYAEPEQEIFIPPPNNSNY